MNDDSAIPASGYALRVLDDDHVEVVRVIRHRGHIRHLLVAVWDRTGRVVQDVEAPF